jgi:hypothetical protein
MYRKDQIKGIIALILFSAIGLSYLITESEDISLIVSIICLGIWLVGMFILNRRT